MTDELTIQAKLAEIRQLHSEIFSLAKTTLEKAVRIGELLEQIKGTKAHGEWLPWLKANVPFSRQTADNYRRLYADRAKLLTVGNLTEAYRLLAADDCVGATDEGPWSAELSPKEFREAYHYFSTNPSALGLLHTDLRANDPANFDTEYDLLDTLWVHSLGPKGFERENQRRALKRRRVMAFSHVQSSLESLRSDPERKLLLTSCELYMDLCRKGTDHRTPEEEGLMDALSATILSGFGVPVSRMTKEKGFSPAI